LLLALIGVSIACRTSRIEATALKENTRRRRYSMSSAGTAVQYQGRDENHRGQDSDLVK
jgi:hypothetical protein